MSRVIAGVLMVSAVATVQISVSYGQTFADASVILRQADHAKLINGDIDRAMSLYRSVAESAAASRTDVAKALISLGEVFELIGSDEAPYAYSRVVSEFSDQPDEFVTAREALIRLSGSLPEGMFLGSVLKQDYTLVLEDIGDLNANNTLTYDFSPDGSVIVVGARALEYRREQYPTVEFELYLVNAGSTVLKPLVEDPGEWAVLNNPRWSQDGRFILFVGRKHSGYEAEPLAATYDIAAKEITIIGPRTLGRSWAWLPNSSQFVTLGEKGFEIRSKDGSLVREYETDMHYATRIGDVSSDGRYVLFHKTTENSEINSEKDIWMLDLRTGAEVQLTDYDGYEAWATWSLDGASFYYASGTPQNIYRKRIDSDAPPEKITSYSNASVVFPHIIPKTGQLTFALTRTNNTIVTAQTNEPELAKEVIRGSSPQLSDDGKTIYYVDHEPGREGIWRASINGDNPVHLVSGDISLSYGQLSILSPDNTQIAYFRNEDRLPVLYTMPSQGGPAKKLYTSSDQHYLAADWSPDGRELAFADGQDLIVLPPEGGPAETIAQAREWEGWTVKWSPDGEYLAAFAYVEGEDENALFVVHRRTGEMKRLTPVEESAYKEILDWHPSGEKITYMYYTPAGDKRDGTRIVSLSGSKPATLADMPYPMWDYIGAWGPDGRYYFESVGWGNWTIFAVDENSEAYEKIIQPRDGRAASLPTWSKDGSVMAWNESESIQQLWVLTDYE